MTSSKKNNLDLGKNITNKKAEESKWQCIYPNERRERNQVYTLLNISENVFEQDERSLEYVIRTGWEEAVQGWGKAAPLACLQFQKQAKKSRASETVNSCLFCLGMRQTNDKSVSQETKIARDQSKLECKFGTCDETVSEKREVPVHSSESSACSATDGTKRENCNGKLRSLQTCQGEKKSLPLKEYSIWHPEKVKNLEALNGKAVKTPEPTMPTPDSSESGNLKSLLVLPPVKDATPKDSGDPSLKKSKAVISQANQKMPSSTSAGSASNSEGTKTIEQKGDKETDCIIREPGKEKKNHEPSPFIPRLPKASFLPGGPEQIHWALWPDRKIASTSNTLSLRKNSHLATMEFLHTKGIRCRKHDELRGPFTNSFKTRSLSEAKQGNDSNTKAIQLLPGLFPSLTVSHAAIIALSSRLT
uniref:Chromosome 16 open reading frame 46 n=1 Tax=Pelusios castaneus TaxID=367368 RepID=A0A8C8RB35_9SAUR